MISRAILLLCFLVATLLSSSCNTDEPGKSLTDVSKKLDTLAMSLDTLSKISSGVDSQRIQLMKKIAFLDSNLKYGQLADQMVIKMTKAEADYYRTNDEKYYKLFFKYRKKQWEYVGLCNRYNDSLNAE